MSKEIQLNRPSMAEADRPVKGVATPSSSAFGHAVPVVEIRFSDLNHNVGVAVADQTPSNIFMQVGRGISRLGGALTCQDRSGKRRLGVLRVRSHRE